MNCIKITFVPKEQINDKDATSELFWDYLGCLYKNGQILKDYLLVKNKHKYTAIVTASDDNALDERYNNIYVEKYLNELKNHFEISMEIFGENLDIDEPCGCVQKPEWYMLYTCWADEESPVVCGRCGKSVPLYKLPYLRAERTIGNFVLEDEHHTTLSWKAAYQNVDKLWLYCLSDRFTYRQMNSVESQLAKNGRNICKEFEKATEVPFYYYLFHSTGLSGKKKTPAICPSCGGDWKLTGEKIFVDYKCDKCRLVADEV